MSYFVAWYSSGVQLGDFKVMAVPPSDSYNINLKLEVIHMLDTAQLAKLK